MLSLFLSDICILFCSNTLFLPILEIIFCTYIKIFASKILSEVHTFTELKFFFSNLNKLSIIAILIFDKKKLTEVDESEHERCL